MKRNLRVVAHSCPSYSPVSGRHIRPASCDESLRSAGTRWLRHLLGRKVLRRSRSCDDSKRPRSLTSRRKFTLSYRLHRRPPHWVASSRPSSGLGRRGAAPRRRGRSPHRKIHHPVSWSEGNSRIEILSPELFPGSHGVHRLVTCYAARGHHGGHC